MNKHPVVTGLSGTTRETDERPRRDNAAAPAESPCCDAKRSGHAPECGNHDDLQEPEDQLDELAGDCDGAPVGDRVMTCFRCNRPDFHFHGLRPRWYWSVLVGFSFGLVIFTGPYRCRCCGARRWMCWDFTHPRCWMKWLSPVRYGSGFRGNPGR